MSKKYLNKQTTDLALYAGAGLLAVALLAFIARKLGYDPVRMATTAKDKSFKVAADTIEAVRTSPTLATAYSYVPATPQAVTHYRDMLLATRPVKALKSAAGFDNNRAQAVRMDLGKVKY